ncbi:MAG: class II aldolase/adducin family protein [Steroidobacteraceae bacterium]
MNRAELHAHIADASRILAGLGILDAFGHVSTRAPDGMDRFLMSRSLAPALVRPEDVIELDLDGRCVSDPEAKPFLERFIHAEIYRRRPDVGAVVHSHCPDVLPFTVVAAARVRPICHVCGFLAGTPPPFDLAVHAGEGTDLLIRESRMGAALAQHLGERAVVLMRGHGYTAVGADIIQATFRAVYTARNCRIEREARVLGEPTFLSDAEAAACDATTNGQIGRAWALWRNEWGLRGPEESMTRTNP